MKNRERVEDLGRISEILKQICSDRIFDDCIRRPKHFIEWFRLLSQVDQEDYLESMAFSLRDLEEKLCECYQIARWGDDLSDE